MSGGIPAVMVVSVAEAAAAVALRGPRGVLLLSAEGAAGFLGPLGWRALLREAAADDVPDALCCGAAPGDALMALRAGCRRVVLDGRHPSFARVAAAAAEIGAVVLPARPPALEVRRLDLRRAGARAILATWLTGTGQAATPATTDQRNDEPCA